MARIVASGVEAIARGASYQRVILARRLSMPSFMTGKRSRLITIAAAGTVTVATAVSATAATLPSGSAAASAGAADSLVLAANQHRVARVAQSATMSETMSEEQRMILSTRALRPRRAPAWVPSGACRGRGGSQGGRG
jgi:hypothetical protein